MNDINEYMKKDLDDLEKCLRQFNQKLRTFIKLYGSQYDINGYMKVVDEKCDGVRLIKNIKWVLLQDLKHQIEIFLKKK